VSFGASFDGSATTFRVWAPRPRRIALELLDPAPRLVPLAPVAEGLFETRRDDVLPGTRYWYVLDGERRRPDPAARAQPAGVHGPSQVVDPSFAWQHPRRRWRMAELVLHELHIGTFTTAGTFDAAAAHLDALVDLGITAVEIMPVASFSGARNWGYDGVGWFAPQASYVGPDGLRRLVDACHGRGLAVILDVVYNHFGPEGCYVSEFAPWFTARHKTPWGDAIDYDGEHAAMVRAHVLDNVRQWLRDYRVDGLRLDAVHAIVDDSPRHIVADIARVCHEEQALAIAESDLGEARVISGRDVGGWDCDAQWSDDFHHALHAVVTGERKGYYGDFGALAQLARALGEGYVYQGQHSAFRGRPFGTPSAHLPGERFVICAQNHDQVGNRAVGERLSQLAPGSVHAVAATLLLAPAVPLLFMGEEHGEPAPFLYFTDHQDAALGEAVRVGRRREFPEWDPGEVPDPQAPETHARSRIDHALGHREPHAGLRRFYRALLRLRRQRPELVALDRARFTAFADEDQGSLVYLRRGEASDTAVAVSLRGRAVVTSLPPSPHGRWRIALDAGAPDFAGPGGTSSDGTTLRLGPWGAAVLVTGGRLD
jgi:maltooligosyltrehalose trehalohydrolase